VPHFTSEGISIAYESFGEGPPVILVHGFGSNRHVNWINTGWTESLVAAGYRAIALDNRGHGESEKLYDPALYSARTMARDVANLIDHLGLGRAALIGYSMGARIAAFVALDAPEKVAAAVFGGLGEAMVTGMEDGAVIVEGLRAEKLSDVTDKTARQYRIFADHTGSDRAALAACMAGTRVPIAADLIARIAVPVLVAVGTEDAVSGPAAPLAAILPQGEVLDITGRDHMRATGDPQFKRGVMAFFERVYPAG